MHFIFLPGYATNDRLFLRDFFANYAKLEGPSVLFHDSEKKNPADVNFLSKRFSGHLSESMVPNAICSGAQRGLLSRNAEGDFEARGDLIRQLTGASSCLIVNPLVKEGDATEYVAPERLFRAFFRAVDFIERATFAANPLSPLVASPKRISDREDYEKLVAVYEEERKALDYALAMKPAVLASPQNFAG